MWTVRQAVGAEVNVKELAERWFEKALTAIRGHANDYALACLVEAIKLNPEFAEAWIVRGNVLHSTERHFDSLLHYDRALSINESLHDAWNNRGLAFADLGMWGEAEHSFRRSAEIMPALEPHMGLANMFCTIMRLEEAAAEYGEAVKYGGGPEAHFNRGVTLLGLGRWEEGFAEYEHRWENTPYPPAAYRNYPKWRGEDLSDKTIVLYPEQGYGDEIMAQRFAIDVAHRWPKARVVVQARAPMLRLAEGLGRGCCSIGALHMHDDNPVSADYSCPLLDVPMVLGLGIPGRFQLRTSYLAAPNREMVKTWHHRLHNLPKGLNVGLCWSSGGHLNTARAAQQSKSIPLGALKSLGLTGVNLISLQKESEPVPDGFPLTADWVDDCHDFADTAALIEALDLVISVDTAVAHLAGALGKPVWNFVRFSGYWPWLTAEAAGSPEHSIWYPSMTLLRQPRLMDWREPIARATKMLSERAMEKAA
jgi:Glycosyltransferase family 9 (heptosyltransferase)/Tetratricopeptide repeat